MKVCREHWELCCQAVKDAGLWHLRADPNEGEEGIIVKAIRMDQGIDFEPLYSLNQHLVEQAVINGGPSVLLENGPSENDLHYCPICLFIQHVPDFDPKVYLKQDAEAMATYCREKGFIKVQ